MCENCKKTGPHGPGCAKTARRLVPPARDVRKLQEDWSPQPGMCENCKKNGPPVLLQFSHKPGVCENCKKTGPTSVVALFARAKTARRLVPPCAETARTTVHFVWNLQEHRSECAKTARTMVHFVPNLQEHRSPMCEKCKNTGGKMCEKCARV